MSLMISVEKEKSARVTQAFPQNKKFDISRLNEAWGEIYEKNNLIYGHVSDGFIAGPNNELDWEIRDQEIGKYLI